MDAAKKEIETQRTIYFDYLRVFATFAVMILHLSAQNWYGADVNGFAWHVFNIYDSLVRWAVPVFVMISGALFLKRKMPLKNIYSKYILRLGVAFVAWSLIYACFTPYGFRDGIFTVFQGNYHLWFIPMMIGLYMGIPVVKPIVARKSRTKYYLWLMFAFAFLIPQIQLLIQDFGSERLIGQTASLNNDIAKMRMSFALGYTGYFVLGYYIDNKELIKEQRMAIYALGLLGFLSTIGLDAVVALKTQEPCLNYYDEFTVNVLLEALAVFTWFKYKQFKHKRLNALMRVLAKYSFGAYLVHALVMDRLNMHLSINSLSFNPVFSVPIIGVLIFVISFGVSALLNQIPIVKKYMV